jgi:hypothetical protein
MPGTRPGMTNLLTSVFPTQARRGSLMPKKEFARG